MSEISRKTRVDRTDPDADRRSARYLRDTPWVTEHQPADDFFTAAEHAPYTVFYEIIRPWHRPAGTHTFAFSLATA